MRLLPGLALSGAVAVAAVMLSQNAWLAAHGMSALTLAIVLGMLIGNTVFSRIEPSCAAGVNFSKAKLLRLGIVLYGLRLTVQDIGAIGLSGVAVDAVVLSSTFALACWLGMRWLRLDRDTAMLIGAGSSICGAAAVMAAAPVLRAKAEQVTVAVATVVVFGTTAMFLYPVLQSWAGAAAWLPSGDRAFGIYIGSTVHEVAQVVVAGQAISQITAEAAVVTKMVRVMMLAPVLLALSFWVAARSGSDGTTTEGGSVKRGPISIPWFAFAFIAMVLFNSLEWLPANVVGALVQLDNVVLAMAMAALGLTTHAVALKRAGLKPLALASVLFVWLVVGGAAINYGIPHLLASLS